MHTWRSRHIRHAAYKQRCNTTRNKPEHRSVFELIPQVTVGNFHSTKEYR